MGYCNKRYTIYIWLISVLLLVILISLTSCENRTVSTKKKSKEIISSSIDYYTCGMHPSVRVTPEEYKKGKKSCPICNMPLVPVYAEKEFRKEVMHKEHKDKKVLSRVKLKEEQLRLDGVKTELLEKRYLYKEIRTVGTVAYDPELAIAEEEFISAVEALDKIKNTEIPDVTERARKLVVSSRRKLRLLGLSEKQINELESARKVHTNLILPEEIMWIYGDVYEFEIEWVRVGSDIAVTTPNLPGEVFYGRISSLNPVLDPKTRSLRFRAEVKNSSLKLKPEMYVDVFIKSVYISPSGDEKVLAVPMEAVLDTGLRKLVWVDKGDGLFLAKEINLGPEAVSDVNGEKRKFYHVLSGLHEGEMVVTRANFLIDSQSQLTGGMAGAYGGTLKEGEDDSGIKHKHVH